MKNPIAPQNQRVLRKALLLFGRRLRYALKPKKLYAGYRAARDLPSYEPELKMLHLLVDPNRNAIEGGANRDSYCYFLSKPCRHVHALKTNPVMRDYLASAANKNVTIHPEAHSDCEGMTVFTVPVVKNSDGYRNTSGTIQQEVYDSSTSYQFEVSTKCLDDLPINNIGFIKAQNSVYVYLHIN